MIRKFLSLSLLLIIFIIALSGCYVGPGVTDYSYNLCGGYKLYKCSAHDIKVVPKSGWNDNTPVIPTQVLNIAWDKQFIIATQQDIKENGKAASDKINYWILDTKTPMVYGPLNKTDFENEKKNLKITDFLTLKPVDSYQNKK